jgi:uncharacterized protein YvpB
MLNPSNARRKADVWDDPQEQFVGYINGFNNTSGYGVHWNPVLNVVRALGYCDSFVVQNADWETLQNFIRCGFPVITWHTLPKAEPDVWKTPSGNVVLTTKAMTVRVLRGFADNTVELCDPTSGLVVQSVDAFMESMCPFDHTGVVVVS